MEGSKGGFIKYYSRGQVTDPFEGGREPELLYASWVDTDSSRRHPRIMHSHNHSAEIVLVCSGEAEFLIGYNRYHVKTGDLIIYNAGVIHDEMTNTGSRVSLWCIAMTDVWLRGFERNHIVQNGEGVCFETEEAFEDLFYLFEEIFHSLKDQRQMTGVYAHYLACALLIRIRQLIRKRTAGGETDQEGDVNVLGQRIKDYIDEHFHENPTLQSMSEAMHCSKYYISHVFKDTMGYSPMNYLVKRRIGEAQNLLIATDLPLLEISQKLGYETQSYFTSQFTKLVGMSPMTYRKKYACRPG